MRSIMTTYRASMSAAACLLVVPLLGCGGESPATPTTRTPRTVIPPAPLRIVVDGSSLAIRVNGVPSFAEYLEPAVVNCAIGGQTTRDMLARPDDVDARYDPNARNVLIAWEGTNDLYFGASVEAAVDHLLQYRQRMVSRGYTVILLSVLPRQSTPDPVAFEQQRLAVNAKLRAAAVDLIDVGADPEMGLFSSVTSGLFYQPDKVHLTEAGARRVASLVAAALPR